MESKRPSIRVPKVTPDDNRGSIRIRFRLAGKDYQITGWGQYDDPICLANAERICQVIKLDILSGQFDPTLDKYRPKVDVPENVVSIAAKQKNLREVWEAYKLAFSATTEETTKLNVWKQVDRCLARLAPTTLEASASYKLIPELLLYYSPGTLYRVCICLDAASNFGASKQIISGCHWNDLRTYLPEMTPNQRSKQTFTEDEVNHILDAFKTNKFSSKFSAYKDSFYADFVEFLLLTGCRPSEAIALRWKHVKGNKIHIKQASVYGITKGTKSINHNREFPVNTQLRALLDKRCPEAVRNPETLVFPGQRGGRLCLRTFSSRYWKRIVDALHKEGKIEIYLPTYNLRHTALSFYAKKGVDMATLAKLMGTSEEMLKEHYLGADRAIQLPEI